MEPTRDQAWELFCEWTESDSLRKHALAVEACMVAYAGVWGEDPEAYAITGLVHDLDYERHPDLETGHPRIAMAELEKLGYPKDVIDAVAGHAEFLEVPRETRMAKTLFAVDELSGFVGACAISPRSTLAANDGCFSFFRTDLTFMPSMPVGRTSAQAPTKPESSSTANSVFAIVVSRGTPR